MKYVLTDFRCKFCGSQNIVKYGTTGGIQYWWCKDCRRKFADNDALPDMKTPIRQISSALSMYYRGVSIDEIREHLDQQYDNRPSDSTVYEWITRFSAEATNKAGAYTPNVGDVWIADETVLKIGGHNVWFWDLIDIKTRFLLASHMSFRRTTQHARNLVEKASKKAGKTPRIVITDKLFAYLDGIELAFGADTQHIQSKGFQVQPNTNLIERFHGTLKGRTKVMRGLKKPETALLFLDGWLVYYNFFRPHEALSDKTPAEKAGLHFPYKNWLDVVRQGYLPEQRETARAYYIRDSRQLGLPTKYGQKKRKRKKKVARVRLKQMPTLSSIRA